MPETPGRAPGEEELRLLLVEDNPADVDLVREYLAEGGVSATLRVSATLGDALSRIEEGGWSLVLLDLNLPDSRGLETLEGVLGSNEDLPVVVLTGLGDEETGAAALRGGAQDFLPKDEITGPALRRTLRHAIERKRHEIQVHRAEVRAQRYLDIAEVLLVGLDPDGRITMLNRAGAKLLGYDTPSQVEGENWFDLALPPADRDRFREVHRMLRSGDEELTHYENPIVTRSGVERMMAWKTSLVRGDDDDVVGTLSCGLDISERRASRAQVQLLNEALQSAHDAIVITDLEGRIEWANPAFTGMTGYTLPESIGRTFGELIQSEEHDHAFYRNLWGAILNGEVWQGRIVNRRKDGTLYPEYQSITPVRDASGSIAHFVAVKRDVTEEVRSEKEILRTNRALRVISGGNQALVRSSSEEEILNEVCRVAVEVGGYRFAWIAYMDENDPERIRPVAHRGEEDSYLEEMDFRVTEGEDVRNPIVSAIREREPAVIHELDGEGVDSEWARAASDRGFRSKVALPLVADGECFGALCILSEDPDAFEHGEIEVLSELSEDLAHGIEAHRTRDRAQQLEDQLQQAEKLRAVGQLAGGVAHDFNNYLTVISTLTDVVLQDPGLSEESRDELGEVREAVQSSARLTRQLLAFSRQQVAALQVVDLNDQIRETGSMLDRLLEESIRIEFELAEGPLPVRVDPGQLEQVMMNLTVNARDAMLDGGTLSIDTRREDVARSEEIPERALEPGPYAVLSVRDTGAGIRDEDLQRIFEPFFTSKKEGTGLGLSTVYGIVKQFGGTIRVDSELGSGTRFQIFLPLTDAEKTGGSSTGEPVSDALEGTETVLVVEDQPSVRRAVRRILERSGYEVLECGSLAEATEISRDPDVGIHLLLTDLGLPDGNGREVAERFLETKPGLPVIYTSGYTPQELAHSLTLGKHQHFIEKPFELNELVRLVRGVLDEARPGGS